MEEHFKKLLTCYLQYFSIPCWQYGGLNQAQTEEETTGERDEVTETKSRGDQV